MTLARAAIIFGLVLVTKGAWSYVGSGDQGAPYLSVEVAAPAGIAVGVVLIVVGYLWQRKHTTTS